MALFLSTVVNKVDAKGRVSVPAAFRASLADTSFQGIVAVPSFRLPALHCAGMDWMEQLSSSLDSYDLFSEEQDDLSASLFADAHALPFGEDGRILLPAELIGHAGLNGQAAFVGRGRHFEIWEPVAFQAHKMAARQRAAERGMTVRATPEAGA